MVDISRKDNGVCLIACPLENRAAYLETDYGSGASEEKLDSQQDYICTKSVARSVVDRENNSRFLFNLNL